MIQFNRTLNGVRSIRDAYYKELQPIGADALKIASQGGIMVKTLTVKCPHCNQISEIFLSTNACVIILNCPTCLSPVMYFDRKIFPLSKTQIDEIKETKESGAMMKMLERISRPEQPVIKTAHKLAQVSGTVIQGKHLFLPNLEPHQREKYIRDDDITNLRIELALCHDSGDFIDLL